MDPDAQGVVRFIWSAIKFLYRPVKKFLLFTGLIYPAILGILQTIFLRGNHFPGYIWGLAWLVCLYFFVQNMVRMISKDGSFSLLALIFGQRGSRRERAAMNPAAAKALTVGTPQGVIFGRRGGHYIVKPETLDGHVLTVGGAGSGKSSCLAIPTLLSWRSGVFAIDIKGELFEKTQHARPNIRIFNPLSASSPGYDPFYILNGSYNPAQDAREITLAIMPTPPNVKDPFWIESAQNIFSGAILHCHGLGYSFIGTISKIQSTPIKQLVAEIHGSGTREARYYVNQVVGMDDKTLAGIASEMSNRIMVFATDRDIRSCLSKSDCITPEDLENGEDIYINIPEDKLEQWKGLLTLIVNQHLKHFERRPDMNAAPILFLLDEFPRLGKVETIVNGLATLRSKKITMCLLIQSLAQLDMIYGKEARQVIADNCQYKAVLSATDADTQEYFSRLVGTYERTRKSQSANFEQYTGMGTGTGESRTQEEKRIIKPETFAALVDIVLLTPFGFCRVKKTPYYSDKAFS